MLKIRLRRMGAKKAPFYRIVVADSRAPRDGAFVEEIGYYNPLTDPAVDKERRTAHRYRTRPAQEERSDTVTEEANGRQSMSELVKFIAMSLVDKPDEVKVEEKEGDKATVIELSVAAEDMGKVIGKQGRIAQAIRCVVKAASVKENKKYIVEIV